MPTTDYATDTALPDVPCDDSHVDSLQPNDGASKPLRGLLFGFAATVTIGLALASWYVGLRIVADGQAGRSSIASRVPAAPTSVPVPADCACGYGRIDGGSILVHATSIRSFLESGRAGTAARLELCKISAGDWISCSASSRAKGQCMDSDRPIFNPRRDGRGAAQVAVGGYSGRRDVTVSSGPAEY